MGVNRVNQQTESQIKQVEGVLFAAMKALHTMAPHPDKPKQEGALFIQADSAYEPPAEYDGMLGSMMVEGMLGGAFGAAAGGVGWDEIAEFASTFVQDRSEKPAYKVASGNALSGTFNSTSSNPAMMAAYLRDLPKRLGMERWVADHQRKLYALRKHAAMGLAA